MHALFWLIDTLLTLAFWIILIQVIMSWLINFNVINARQPFVHQVWTGLYKLTEPIYRPIRNMMPNLGGIDLSPMIVMLAILFIQRLVMVDLQMALM